MYLLAPIATLLVALLLPFVASAAEPTTPAAEPAKTGTETDKPAEPETSVTRHQVRIDGQVVRYSATVGWMIMKNDATEVVRAEPFEEVEYSATISLKKEVESGPGE